MSSRKKVTNLIKYNKPTLKLRSKPGKTRMKSLETTFMNKYIYKMKKFKRMEMRSKSQHQRI